MCRRCFARATNQEFAVKRLSPGQVARFPFLMENEIEGLIHANYSTTPRVVEYIDLTYLPTGEALIILE